MGACYQFTCAACGYTAEVSGGLDSGMMNRAATISCADCRELMDVDIGPVVAEEGRRRRARCEVDPAHRSRRWNAGGPCPRCGAPVERGPLTLLWD